MADESGVGIRRLGLPPSKTPGHWCVHRMRPLFHRSWVETEAVVESCLALKGRAGVSRDASPSLWGYAVCFTYAVNGRTYTGVTTSPDAMESGDTFAILYNPVRPAQNNSFDGETGWIPMASWVINAVLGLAMVGCFVWYRVMGHN